MKNNTEPNHRMTGLEKRASASLATVFALRMVGLFVILPVFSLEAAQYSGGNNAFLIGLALGVYGLTQAIFQLPMGWASDRWGRKPVIVLGLLVFAAGGLLAAGADNMYELIAARAIQGAGTVSAAVTALLADLTRDTVRTKSMAIVGVSIGAAFALSLIIGAPLNGRIGLSGIFLLISLLTIPAIATVLWFTPAVTDAPPAAHSKVVADTTATASARSPQKSILSPALLRLYAGVFVLHTVQLAMWAHLPQLLLTAGLEKPDHWHVYLPAVGGSLLVVGGLLFRLERKGHLRTVFLLAIALLCLALTGLAALSGQENTRILTMAATPLLAGFVLFVFFCGFNTLEASQPSLVSQHAAASNRGSALGIYNTMQSLGLFAGGAAGGWLLQHSSPTVLFGFCALLTLLWLWLAWGMPAAQKSRS